jgi:hypothetical protein
MNKIVIPSGCGEHPARNLHLHFRVPLDKNEGAVKQHFCGSVLEAPLQSQSGGGPKL